MQKEIKAENRIKIIKTIRLFQPISRSELSRQLNLSRSVVSSIVETLITDGFVEETGKSNSTVKGGRRPIHLIFNPKARFGLGIDMGGTKTLMVITDLNGSVVAKKELPTPKTTAPLAKSIKQFIQETAIDENKIVSMGMGLAGMIDSHNGNVVDSPNLGLHEFNIVNLLAPEFSFPIYVNNDVNCAIYGEKLKGKGQKCRNFVFIAIGTGVGSAIIVNDQLVEGHRFAAGEIGYFIDREDIRNSHYGRLREFGPFENRISGTALTKIYGNSRQLFKDYLTGDKLAKEIIDSFVVDLSMVIANFLNILNPEKVIIGGGVSKSMAPILSNIRKAVALYSPIETTVELSALENDGCAIGAAAYAFANLNEF